MSTLPDSVADVSTQPSANLAVLQKPVGWAGWTLVVLLILLYADIATTWLLGSRDSSAWGGTAICTGAAVAYFRNRRGQRAWPGFFMGLVVGVAGICATAFVCGLIGRFL
jgi:uncharacterized membrane protein HdeD (DUF308 family)